MEQLPKIIISYKKIKISNPEMFVWFVLPLFALYIVTHYFFEKPKNEVLGISTESQPVILSPKTVSDVNTKDESIKWNGAGVVSLLFTGSHRSQYELAYPLLNSRGYLASVSVPTGDVALPGSMTWLNLKILQSRGWEIISQSKNQICDKDKLKDNHNLESEVIGSKDDLSKMDLVANIYLPPCGITTPEVIKEVKNNYSGLITFGVDPNKVFPVDRYNLVTRQVNNKVNSKDIAEWIRGAKQNHTWLILSFPDISDVKNNNNVSLTLLNSTLDEISKSGIRLALPKEIINYGKK